jgi:hypothetical protein
MDASEAREHLEMVERIIAASSRKLEAGGEFFVAWGLASGAFTVLLQLVANATVPSQALWLALLFYGSAGIFSFFRGRYYGRGAGSGERRMSFLQREFYNVLSLTMAMAFVADFVGFHIFTNWATAAIWTVAGAIVLFFVGMHGNRRATIGGIVMVASLAFANFTPEYTGYALAAGFLLGYAGFGAVEMFARD